MKCPLLWKEEPTEDKRGTNVSGYCLKEECARWDEVKGCCGERTKRLQIERIADTLKDIRDKMPHEKQFRR